MNALSIARLTAENLCDPALGFQDGKTWPSCTCKEHMYLSAKGDMCLSEEQCPEANRVVVNDAQYYCKDPSMLTICDKGLYFDKADMVCKLCGNNTFALGLTSNECRNSFDMQRSY